MGTLRDFGPVKYGRAALRRQGAARGQCDEINVAFQGVPVPGRDRSYLSMFAALTSVFAVVLVAIVAAAGNGAAVDDSTVVAARSPWR